MSISGGGDDVDVVLAAPPRRSTPGSASLQRLLPGRRRCRGAPRGCGGAPCRAGTRGCAPRGRCFRNAASIAFSNSASSTSTESLTLLPSRGSTVVFTDQGVYRQRRARPAWANGSYDPRVRRRAAPASCARRIEIGPNDPSHRDKGVIGTVDIHVSGNRAMLREEDFSRAEAESGWWRKPAHCRSSLAGPRLHRLGPVRFSSDGWAVADASDLERRGVAQW